ncbi:hypothetical protein CLOM_g6622, partial [Closterium sp. NIES-68]
LLPRDVTGPSVNLDETLANHVPSFSLHPKRRPCPWLCDNNGVNQLCRLNRVCADDEVCIPYVSSCEGYKCMKLFQLRH